MTDLKHSDVAEEGNHGPARRRVQADEALLSLQVVKLEGTHGTNFPKVVKITNADIDEGEGVVISDIANGAEGKIVAYDTLRNVDTSGLSLGKVYATSSGTLSNTESNIPVGTVTEVHATTGKIEIRLAAKGAMGVEGPPIASVSVADWTDPVELGTIAATDGDTRVVYETVLGKPDPSTLKIGDSDGPSYSNSPFWTKGLTGIWKSITSSFSRRRQDVFLNDPSLEHGKTIHNHGVSGDPDGGRNRFSHAGTWHEIQTKYRYAVDPISGTEIDFYQGKKYRTKTLNNSGSPVAMTVINAELEEDRWLVIDSDTTEIPTFPSNIKVIGDYDPSTTNYGRLICCDPGMRASATVDFPTNDLEAGDGFTLEGVPIRQGTEFALGSDTIESLVLASRAVEDSTDVAIQHLVYSTPNRTTGLITIEWRDSGVIGNGKTLTEIDTGVDNVTVSGNLAGGVDPVYILVWSQEGNLNFTESVKADIIGNSSTTWLTGGTISINADDTKYDVAAGTGQIVNPITGVKTEISWNQILATAPSGIGGNDVTFIAIDSAGTIFESNSDFTETERRDYITLGAILHTNNVNITVASNSPIYSEGPGVQLNDLWEAVGKINTGGNVYSANGANLNINRSAGSVAGPTIDPTDLKTPNNKTTASASALTFFYNSVNAGAWTVTSTALIDPDQYNIPASGLASVPNNKYQIKRIFFDGVTELTTIHYGQAVYGSIAEAEGALNTEVFTKNPDAVNFPLRGYLIVKKGNTDLSDTSEAKFIEASKIDLGGSTGGATSSTTTLQQAYDNSPEPEILTDATGGSFTVQRGSAADTDDVIEVQNGAGTKVFSVTGEGEAVVEGQAYSPANVLSQNGWVQTDCSLGNVHSLDLNQSNLMKNPTNMKDGATYIWIITQDSLPRVVTYESTFKFPGGVAPVNSTAIGAVDILTGVSDGTNVYCTLAKDFK